MGHLLSTEDFHRVEKTIVEAEKHTAGEIVAVVANRSAPYDDWKAFATGVITVFVAISLYLYAPFVPGLWIITGQVPLSIFLWWGIGRPLILHRIVPEQVKSSAVSARAKELFVERGLTETRDRSGVLVLLSELERRIEILADKGIHQRVGTYGWQEDVNRIAQAINKGSAVEGLCKAIEHIGEQLAQHFPPRPDDVDELPNRVERVDG